MNTEEKITARLTELLAAGERVLVTRRALGPGVVGDDRVDSQMASQWITSVQSLLSRVLGAESEHYKNFSKHVEGYVTFSDVHRAQGVLRAAAEDYAGGYLFEVRHLIEAEIFDDFLEQAEHLLLSGYYQATAVIVGCVLEDGLRTMCPKFGISVLSRPKLDQMNSDLAKAGAYNKLVQKRITALADLRNKAAHGLWDQFGKDDVADMVASVRRFMEEYCA